MTDQTIDIADAEIPIPGPVVAAVRKMLGQMAYDSVGNLPTQIDEALRKWVATQPMDDASEDAAEA